ncbi:hypothetical protein JKG47_18560 [Acidithiobacillus sp. MC6.1]|nr:hypothetical protein [Acidithiobacillus sp. MC6.1]
MTFSTLSTTLLTSTSDNLPSRLDAAILWINSDFTMLRIRSYADCGPIEKSIMWMTGLLIYFNLIYFIAAFTQGINSAQVGQVEYMEQMLVCRAIHLNIAQVATWSWWYLFLVVLHLFVSSQCQYLPATFWFQHPSSMATSIDMVDTQPRIHLCSDAPLTHPSCSHHFAVQRYPQRILSGCRHAARWRTVCTRNLNI